MKEPYDPSKYTTVHNAYLDGLLESIEKLRGEVATWKEEARRYCENKVYWKTERDAAVKDAERWRWARTNDDLWNSGCSWAISLPEGADEIADAAINAARGNDGAIATD